MRRELLELWRRQSKEHDTKKRRDVVVRKVSLAFAAVRGTQGDFHLQVLYIGSINIIPSLKLTEALLTSGSSVLETVLWNYVTSIY